MENVSNNMMVVPTKDIMIIKNFLNNEQILRFADIINRSEDVDMTNHPVDTVLKIIHISKEDQEFQANIVKSIYKEIFLQFNIKEQDNKINHGIMNNKTLNLLYAGPGMPVHHDEDFKNRYGVVLYLNNDYDGGELFYQNFGISIAPEAGTLVVHPAGKLYSHGVKPISRGTRYTLTLFIENEQDDATFELCNSWDQE